jgi:DNA-binding MarR family transcriptional regulator
MATMRQRRPAAAGAAATRVGDSTGTVLAAELLDGVRRLRRLARRSTRQLLMPVTLAQGEVLQVVAESPGTGVTDCARALCLASNTVSTIVTELVAGGLLERQQAVDDRRTYQLSLTPAAARMMSEGRDRRAEVVAAGLARLSETDRSRLAAALPALDRLITAIDLDSDRAD